MKIGMLFIALVVCFSMITEHVSAVNPQIVVNKSVRLVETEYFESSISGLKGGDVAEFQILVENLSDEDSYPQVRLVDVLPKTFSFVEGNIAPSSSDADVNTISNMWIIRALMPKETRVITYKAKYLGSLNDECTTNAATITYAGTTVNTSSVLMCTTKVNRPGQVLGTVNNVPATGIFDAPLVYWALLSMFLGVIFGLVSKLSKKRYTAVDGRFLDRS